MLTRSRRWVKEIHGTTLSAALIPIREAIHVSFQDPDPPVVELISMAGQHSDDFVDVLCGALAQ